MPQPLPTDPVELEKAIRALIAAELSAAAADYPEGTSPRVQDRPRYVTTEKEWLDVAGIRHPQNSQGGMETRVVFLSFDGFGEEDEGACDHTQLTLNYSVDVLFSLVDKRKDSSNSHDDFVAYLMRTREQFKQNRSFGYERSSLEHKLLQTAQVARVEPTDFATVHRINLSLDVVVG